MRTALLLGALAVVGSCAVHPPAPRPARVAPAVVDPAVLAELVPLTQTLIRTRPENPPGQEGRVVAALVERLGGEPLEIQTAPFGAQGAARLNLRVTLPGVDRKAAPLLLVAHSDVVTSDPAEWDPEAQPFDARIVGDELRGRGSLDMLGMAALEALTLVALERQKEPLRRDVVFLLVGDEEVASEGIEAALQTWPDLARAALALNEGGFILENGVAPGRDLIAVSVAEKGVFWFDLVVKGESGHGSIPRPDNDAPARLVRAVQRVLDREDAMEVTGPAERMLAAMGHARGGLEGFVLTRPALVTTIGSGKIEERDNTRVLVHDTCALTVLAAGQKTNVIPAEARATFDCRLLPGTDPATFRDELLLAIDDPRVDLVVQQASPANGSAPEGPFVDAVRAVVEAELEGSATVPLLTRGYTDNRATRARGIPSYGLIPVRVSEDELAAIHGKNERVRVGELEAGLVRLVSLVRHLANLETLGR